MLILQSGAIIPLQKNRAHQDDVIKRVSIKLQNKHNMAFMFVSCTISRNDAFSSSVHTSLIFSSAAIFRLSSGAEAGVTFKSRDFCTSFIHINLLNLFPLHFVELTFYRYTIFSTSLKCKNLLSIFRDFFKFSVFPIRFFYSQIEKTHLVFLS